MGEPRQPGDDEASDPLDRPASRSDLTSSQSSLLSQEKRKRIVDALERTPGLTVQRIAEAIGVSRDTARFHVGRLQRAGLVARKKGGKGNRRPCFLSWDEHLWEDPRTRILFGSEAPRHVAIVVLEEPGLNTTEVAEAMDFSPRSARRHLTTLEDHGLVDRIRVEQAKEAHPRPPLERWREEVGERFGVETSDRDHAWDERGLG